MSWLYSQALVAASSAGTCSAGEPSVPSSSTPTPQAYCAPDKMTGFSRLSRFGMTFAPLTDDLGADVLTWFLAGFPVRTSALQERAQDSAESVPASGPKWLASWAKYDRDSSSWKTAQLSFLEDLGASSVTWPRSGLMRHGECYPLKTWAHPTKGSGSGLWLTPCATDANPITGGNLFETRTGSVRHMRPDGKSSNRGLATQVRFRTPNASDADKWSHQSAEERRTKGQQIRLGHQLGAGGLLNPDWTEWLMGWPLGWTDLQPLAMDKFHGWQQQHSPNSAEPLSNAA